jgi:hypothetical protein
MTKTFVKKHRRCSIIVGLNDRRQVILVEDQ